MLKKKKQLSVKSVVFVRDKLLRHQPERNVQLGNFFYLLHTSVESYDTRTVFFFLANCNLNLCLLFVFSYPV